MPKSIKQKLIPLLKLLLAAGLIYWLVQKGFLDSKSLLKLLDPFYLGIGFVLVGASVFVTGVRWFLLLIAKGFDVPFRGILSTHYIGVFFNFALPGSVGGDLVKAYYVVRGHPERKLDAAMTVIMDRVIGLYVMIMLGLSGLVFNLNIVVGNGPLMTLFLMLGLSFLAANVFVLLSLSARVHKHPLTNKILDIIPLGHHFKKIYDAIHSYQEQKMTLLKAAALSLASQIAMVVFFLVMGKALGITNISTAVYFFAVPVGFITTALPISPAGIGVGQVAMLFLFKTASGVESEIGPTALTLFQILFFVWGLSGAFLYIRNGKFKNAVASEGAQ